MEGFGQAGSSPAYAPAVAEVVADQLGPMLVGRDPAEVGALWQEMFEATHMWGRRGIETYALSGIDMALWDLLGKISGQPVYRLLGACKPRVRAYFAPSLKPTGPIVAECREAVGVGFTAVKLRVGGQVDQAVELVGSVREAVGPGVDIMVDANMGYDRRGALVLARELEPFALAWLEEPILARSLTQYVDDHAWLAHRTGLPLAGGGDSALTHSEFTTVLARGAFDVLLLDCGAVGGISEARRVAAAAVNSRCVPYAGAGWPGPRFAAGLHLALGCQNIPMVQVPAPGHPSLAGRQASALTVTDGFIEAPAHPGLGWASSASPELRTAS
jgi:L-alanine-DL-glutamate epimerase-like enolase superfamily enzyme